MDQLKSFGDKMTNWKSLDLEEANQSMEDEDDEDLDEVEEIGDEDEGDDEEDPLNQGNGDGEEEEEEDDDDEEGEEEEDEDDDEEGSDDDEDDDEEEEEVEAPEGATTPQGIKLPSGLTLTKITSTPATSSRASSSRASSSGRTTPTTATPTRTPSGRGRGSRSGGRGSRGGGRGGARVVGTPGSTPSTERKKPGPKPKTAEEKAKSLEERKKKLADARKAKAKEKADAKAKAKQEAKEAKKKAKGGGGRKWTEEQKKAREDARKAKLEELKRKKQEMIEKRNIKNAEMREKRRKKKEEEARQREAYEKRMQELKASFLDETSTMSGGGGDGAPAVDDEASQGSGTAGTGAGGAKPQRVFGKPGPQEMSQLYTVKSVTAVNLLEYKWPLEGKDSEYYFLQEQVSEYLDIKSFKRRYPDVNRRNVDHEERDFLVEMGVVTVTQADLGLTAIPSTQILDIMSNDFYEKYEEYRTVVAERKDRTMRQTNYSLANVESHQMADFVRSAMDSVANWNKAMNQERKERRTAFFDMQTFAMHYPMTGRGKMEVVKKPKLGHYPIALIPGQFVDHYQPFTPEQLKYLPLNTALKAPPTDIKLSDIGRPKPTTGRKRKASGGSDSDSSDSSGSDDSSGSSGSSSEDSDSDGEDVKDSGKGVAATAGGVTTAGSEPSKPKIPIDANIPGATCKACSGDRRRNLKTHKPEVMLRCTKCESSIHPTCAGLCLDLLSYVTSYRWECTECKGCSKCGDHSDEDKMIFCDLCDRGYHIYCVGLSEIPSGRWHCFECAVCSSCGCKEPDGGVPLAEGAKTLPKWHFEYRTGVNGEKIWSNSLCQPCHKLWKRAQFCPECNVCFGREKDPKLRGNYYYCWVCSRQHHSACVGAERFICTACQNKTLAKRVGVMGGMSSLSYSTPTVGGGTGGGYHADTPGSGTSRSRLGRPRTTLNYSQFA